MSDLREMGEQLVETANLFTHPQFSDTYPEWSSVCSIGESLIEMSEPKLNENQKIVLKWLKDTFSDNPHIYGVGIISDLNKEITKDRKNETSEAYSTFSPMQEVQVLQAFATWALDQC